MVCAGSGASLLFVGDSPPNLASDTPDMILDALSGDSLSAGVSAAELTVLHWSDKEKKAITYNIKLSLDTIFRFIRVFKTLIYCKNYMS